MKLRELQAGIISNKFFVSGGHDVYDVTLRDGRIAIRSIQADSSKDFVVPKSPDEYEVLTVKEHNFLCYLNEVEID